LEAACDKADHIEIEKPKPPDMQRLKKELVKMVVKGPSPLKYWSVRLIDEWSQNEKHSIPGTAKDRRDGIHQLLDEGVFKRQERADEKGGKVTEVVLDKEEAEKGKYLD
jgi:hypothetical protein